MLWERNGDILTVDGSHVSNNEIVESNHMKNLKVKDNDKISDMNDNLFSVSRLSHSDPVLHGRDDWYREHVVELLTTTV